MMVVGMLHDDADSKRFQQCDWRNHPGGYFAFESRLDHPRVSVPQHDLRFQGVDPPGQ